ncbi:MAG: DUF523 and DUF1722 domain-containing protein [Methanothrix sp.]|nr:DUF523 and DUF1722 domain-containing protein [Methanothrix sp.]
MKEFPRPKVVVSKCIEFDHCRYDGSMIPSDFVKALQPHVDFLPVCPEMEIGLGAPRETIRMVSVEGSIRLVQPATGLDLTERMNDFVRGFLSSLPEVDGFILKFRSPSCGMKDIRVYSQAAKSGALSKAPGFFGGKVVGSEANKLLLTAHSQKETKMLGNILANREGLGFTDLSAQYRDHLARALARPPRASSRADVFIHAMGYFKDDLTARQKELFLQDIQRYRSKKIPSSALLAMLHSWAEGYSQEYLIHQSIFQPFPEELVELCQDTQCEWAGEELFTGRQ